jgi:electron transport complex protein RnfG
MKKEVSGFRMLLILGGVCLISAAVLGFVHISTDEQIKFNKKKRIENAVQGVLPGINSYEKINDAPVVFRGDKDGNPAGYAILAEGMGFQGKLLLMVGIDYKLKKLKGMAVLESVETPGLGDKIKEGEFNGQFVDMVIPESGIIKVDTITGATISSVAVEKIVNRAIENVKNIR